MALLDRMVTEFVLDHRKYRTGANAVVADSDRAGHAIDKAKHKSVDFSGTLGMAGRALSALFAAAGAIGAGLVGLGAYAAKAAADFDTLERTLTAVTGSAARAKEILEFVDEISIPSIFSSEILADAAKTLEAFQLKTERFLPIVEKLGTVFGGSAEKLNQFVRALGYIKSGRFGEAFEALAAAGVGRMDMKRMGLKFDKGGSFLGDAKQALDAVEKLVNERYGRLAEEMATGPAARMASMWDQVKRGIRQAGAELLKGFLPYIDLISAKVGEWVKGGEFGKIGKTIAGWFAPTGPVTQGAMNFLAILLEIPTVFAQLKAGWMMMANTAVAAINGIVDAINTVSEHVTNFMNRLIDLMNALPGPPRPDLEHIKSSRIGRAAKPYSSSEMYDATMDAMRRGDPSTNIKDNMDEWTKALQKAFEDAKANEKPNRYSGPGTAGDMAVMGQLDAIEANTYALVEINKRQLQLQEGALGGPMTRPLMGREYKAITGRQVALAG